MKESEKGVLVGEVPVKWFLILHASLIVNSLQGTASKLAGQSEFLSADSIFWYCVMVLLMVVFALVWQQIMKHMSLTFAFTNKPVTIIWGLIWGVTIFHEHLTWKMMLGSAIILIGIMIGVSDNKKAGIKGDGKTSENEKTAVAQGGVMLPAVSTVSLLSAAAPLPSEGGSMFSGLEKYIAVWIISVFISSIAQVMLKVEANKPHESRLKEYLNPMVAGAYAIFFISTILTMYALRYVPLTYSPIIEPLSYIFVPVIGVLVLKERISKRRAAGIAVMFIGIVIFSM